MPRFVILEHDHPVLHWDLMLETGPLLRTWRLSAPPEPGVATGALYLFLHRLYYLDYEGPVSGNRGHVSRWDAGTFELEVDDPGRLVISLHGKHAQGHATLTRLQGEEWSFVLTAGAGSSDFSVKER